ncbi:MAG: ATP-binding protein, partial [Gaiellaceae bacterium]
GEPGVGKSRLVGELRERETGSFRWLEGRCRASGASVSYLPYVELLTEHFGWVPEDDDRERERSIVGSVLELARRGLLDSGRVDELVTMLANVLEVDLSGGALAQLQESSPEQIRHRTFAALRDYLVGLAGERPLALVLEDFHWADALSLDFTALLLESLAASRLLVVCVSRPDPPHRWRRLTALLEEAAGRRGRRVELTVLGPEEARVLLYALLPLKSLSERAEKLILDTSQGNPFFLEELLRELIDSGAVERENGSWTVRTAIDALSVPQSVQAVVLSRVDRLDVETRRVVEKAAVVGRSFPVRVLAALEASPETFERALWELESRDIVRRDRVVPEEEYSFHHVLAQEAVYHSLPRGRRAALHQSTAEAIERIYADDLEEHVEQLAYHYVRSAEIDKAVEYLWRAGEKSRRAYLNTEATAYFERGLGLLEPPEPSDQGAEMRVRLNESLGDVRELTGQHPEAIAAYEAALADVPDHDWLDRARLHRKVALPFHIQRRVEEARSSLDHAESELGRPSEPGAAWWSEWVEIVLERLYLDYFFSTTEQLEQLEVSLATYRPQLEKHASPRRRVDVYMLANLLRLRQRLFTPDAEMLALARKAVAAAYESGSLDAIAAARQALGLNLVFAGMAAESISESIEALRLAEQIGDLTLQCRCLAYLTDAYRRLGDVDRVRELASQTLERAETAKMSEYVAAARASFAWVAVREGHLATASQQAAAALPMFGDESPYRVHLWKAAWPLISVAFAEGRTADAATYAEQLLDPTRYAMPDDLRMALEAVVRADGDVTVDAALDTATSIATRYGYA